MHTDIPLPRVCLEKCLKVAISWTKDGNQIGSPALLFFLFLLFVLANCMVSAFCWRESQSNQMYQVPRRWLLSLCCTTGAFVYCFWGNNLHCYFIVKQQSMCY
jgi:hypothetical protein